MKPLIMYSEKGEEISKKISGSKIFLIISSVLLFVNFFFSNDYLSLLVTLLCAGYIFVVDENELVPSMCFLTFFSYLFRYGPYSLFFIIYLSVFIRVFLIAESERFAFLFFLLLYFVSHLLNSNLSSMSLGAISPIMFNMFLFAFCVKTKIISVTKCNLYFLAGFLISSFLGIFKSYTRLPDVLKDANVSLGRLDFLDRFSGLTYDANFFTMLAITSMFVILLMRGSFHIRLFLFFITLFAGMATYSKSFYFSLVFCIIYLLKYVKKLDVVSLFKYGWIIGVVLICIGGLIGSYFDIFLYRLSNASTLDELTTGRSSLWALYEEEIMSNAFNFLFGHGLGSGLRDAAHNTFLEVLYTFGLWGAVINFAYMFYCIRKLKVKLEFADLILYFSFFLILFNLSAYTFYSLWACFFILFINTSTLCDRKYD